MAVAGDAAEVVTASGAGMACPPQNAQRLASAVRELYAMERGEREQMGARGLEAVRTLYEREVLVGRIEDILRAAVESHGGVRAPAGDRAVSSPR
jgi:glycosyltransferase involved in cell wall biosynthesis